jgi:hypothetical protein
VQFGAAVLEVHQNGVGCNVIIVDGILNSTRGDVCDGFVELNTSSSS